MSDNPKPLLIVRIKASKIADTRLYEAANQYFEDERFDDYNTIIVGDQNISRTFEFELVTIEKASEADIEQINDLKSRIKNTLHLMTLKGKLRNSFFSEAEGFNFRMSREIMDFINGMMEENTLK